ncbi:flagellar protein FliT [Halomonas sp. McH1-25]|uniref:flagellar protein FliT n=1 Tax=unclassified Halomonas TaxID=2609666 RepID=UPI001EF59068|nr:MULTISPECIES: flagellar protein FliT [unclassified Halomonas]MCG7598619.1 flagellar protein FliT [Halomonas sp. McH1-25]MCP1342315.1 flagellar protein FliT [Halomonas sp. FL8]MCP1360650.1 flagellar protein FliT [Halomonas sp. BBD45]MCP1364779.1 flagellar protein FliT [Halomonas sp. BBD48]
MTAANEVLAGYERLLQRSARMLAWARQGEWAHLVQEESVYVVAVEDLKRLEGGCVLDREGTQKKADLLERILEQDAEVRQRLEIRRDELSGLIGDTRRRRDMSRAYGAVATRPTPIDQGRR